MSQELARGPFPSNRFNAAAFYNPQKGRPGNMRYTEGYCISNNLEDFDGGFFGMTASDILYLDPQQRQLLECCFECLESGGVTLEDVAGTMTGVYVGNFASDYETLAFKEPERIEGMAVLGMGRTTVSNRVSYMYNLHGPRFVSSHCLPYCSCLYHGPLLSPCKRSHGTDRLFMLTTSHPVLPWTRRAPRRCTHFILRCKRSATVKSPRLLSAAST